MDGSTPETLARDYIAITWAAGLRPRDDGPGDPASRVISRCCHRSGEVGSRFADVLDGETATVPNARWRKVICDSLET